MDGQGSSQIVPIPSPWREILLQVISQAQLELFIICPYIKEEIVTALKTALLTSQKSRTLSLRVRVLTRARPDELLAGSSDLKALQQLLNWPRELSHTNVELRAIDNIHAKVWIIDATQAIVGSGNATPSGLDDNLEYGLAVTDATVVAQIRRDWEVWWDQAPDVNEQQLEQIQNWLTRSSQVLQEAENVRRELIRTLDPTPRVGKRLSPHAHHSPTPQPVTQPSTPSQLAEKRQAYTESETITVSYAYLLTALRWVYPFTIGQSDTFIAASTNAFLKLTWDKQSNQLICTWANGKRRSQSSIRAQSNNVSSSWAITLDLNAAQDLVTHLTDKELATSQSDIHLSLTSNDQRQWLLRVDHGSTTFTTNVALTSPPSPFPLLQVPISRIDGVIHRDLLDLFKATYWKPQSSTLWLHLEHSSRYASFFFTPNTLEHSIQSVILGEKSLLVGPPITLQLASADLQQALLGTPDTVTRWSIEIDRNAEAMQLVPETKDEIVQQWKHYLWHVGG